MKKGVICSLSQLPKGSSAKILNLSNDNQALRRRFLDMGLTKNVLVKIKKIAPLGDPIDIEVRGYELCIRKSDMNNITVEVQ